VSWYRILFVVAVIFLTRVGSAQIPEHLSNDPEGADIILEQIFRPYIFDYIDDTTQWNVHWRTYYLDRHNENTADSEASCEQFYEPHPDYVCDFLGI